MIEFLLGCLLAWAITKVSNWNEISRLRSENHRLEGLSHHRLEIIADLSSKKCQCANKL